MRRPALTLLLLASLTFLFGLGRQAITDSDEGFYAEASREMVESGDWLTPHFNYVDRWQKPVLYYWLTAATFAVTGPDEASARLWSALSGVGLVFLTWLAARRMTGEDDAAWLAGAITATSFGYFAIARMALPDLPLAFFVTLGIWSALEERWALAGLAAGLGFLMKGPLALVVPGLALLPIWWHERKLRSLSIRDLGVATVVFLVAGLPWYVAMTTTHGTAYLHSFFVGDNLERFATERFNGPRGLWFYIPIIIAGMVPWSMYLLVLPWRSVSDVVRRTRVLTDEEWRLLLWALVPLAFFSVSIGKQPRYILPVLPPVAILLGRSIATRMRHGGLGLATWLTAAMYAGLAVMLWRARPLFIAAYPAVSVASVIALAVAAFALAIVALRRRWERLPVIAAICAATLAVCVQFGALAGQRPEAVEQMASLIAAHRTRSEPVGEYQVFVRNQVFYSGFKQEELFNEERALAFVTSPERVLLVVRATDLPRLESIAARSLARLGQVRYLNTANLRLRNLIWPLPEQDLETVLLVTNR